MVEHVRRGRDAALSTGPRRCASRGPRRRATCFTGTGSRPSRCGGDCFSCGDRIPPNRTEIDRVPPISGSRTACRYGNASASTRSLPANSCGRSSSADSQNARAVAKSSMETAIPIARMASSSRTASSTSVRMALSGTSTTRSPGSAPVRWRTRAITPTSDRDPSCRATDSPVPCAQALRVPVRSHPPRRLRANGGAPL